MSIDPPCPPPPPLTVRVLDVPDTIRVNPGAVSFNAVGLSGSAGVTVWSNGVPVSDVTWSYGSTTKTLRGSARMMLASGTFPVRVQVCDTGGCATDSALVTYAPLPSLPGRVAPIATVELGAAARRAVAGCAACAYGTLGYATPAYRSLDEDRALGLVYSSALSAPRGLVVLDVNPNSSDRPDAISVSLLSSGALVPLTSGGTEVWYTTAPGVTKVSAQFDASGYATGVHDMTALVRNHWSGQTIESQLPVRVLIINERLSGFGSGWSVVGLERLHSSASGHAAIVASGSMLVFTSCGAGCWISPPGESSMLTAAGSTIERRWPDGTTATFNSAGYLTQLHAPAGATTTYDYDGYGRLWHVTDPAGLVTTVTWTGAPGSASTADIATPDGRHSLVQTDAQGQLLSITDPDNVTSLSVNYIGNRIASVTDRLGGVTGFAYDAYGGLASVTEPPRLTDDFGLIAPVTSYRSREVALLPAAGSGSVGAPAAFVAPDQAWLRMWGPRGDTTRILATGAGDATRIVSLDGLGKRDSTMIGYMHDVLPATVATSTGTRTEYKWSAGLLTEVTDNVAAVTTGYGRNGLGLPVQVAVNGTLVEQNFYSTDGRALLDSTRVGSSVTRFLYNASGRLTGVIDPGQSMSFSYQPSGFRNVATATRGTCCVTTFAYDGFGRLIAATDPAGRIDSTAYDLLNRVTRAVGPDLAASTWHYNDATRTYAFRDARNQTDTTVLNAAGAPIRYVDSRNFSESMRWNVDGQLSSSTSRASRTVTNSYDPRGRLIAQSGPGVAMTISYDTAGVWTAYSTAESVDTVFVDGSGRVEKTLTVRSGGTYTVASLFGAHGERQTMTVTGTPGSGFSKSVTFGEDPLGRATGIGAFGVPALTGVTYDAAQRPQTITLPAGSAPSRLGFTMSYDGYSQLTGVTATDQTQTLNWHYNYDFWLQRLTTLTQGIEQPGGEQNAEKRTVDYDVAGRLKHWRDTRIESGEPHMVCSNPFDLESCHQVTPTVTTILRDSTYTYDAVGNRTDLGAVAGVGNRLTSFNGYAMTYDDDGNLVSKVGHGVTQSFAWNGVGQLTQVTTNGVVMTFGYDAFGRRVRKTTPAGTTSYLYDGDNLIMQLDGAGQPQLEFSYYPGVDNPHAVRQSATGAVFYYTTSQPGHVTALVNQANQIVNSYAYSPFGQPLVAQEQVAQPFRFAGREWDGETGLYYNRARYYDPSVARFISEDPIGRAGGVNQYVYAGNDPVNYADPSGMCSVFEAERSVYKQQDNGDWTEVRTCPGGKSEIYVWGNGHPLAPFLTLQRVLNAVGRATGVSGLGEGVDRMTKGEVVAGGLQVAISLPVLPAPARTTMNEAAIFARLARYHGIPEWLASQRLHAIKKALGRGGSDNVLFDLTGGVWDPTTREWLGSLTEGGAKKFWRQLR